MSDTENEILLQFLPKKKRIKVSRGTNVLEAARWAGINIPGFCGNRGKCGKCKIKVMNVEIPYTREEEIALSPEERSLGVHLACQLNLQSDMTVEIISEERIAKETFLTYEIGNMFEVDNHLKKTYLEMINPDIENQVDDYSNLEENILHTSKRLHIPLPVLQNLSTFLRKNKFKVTLVSEDNQVLCIETGDTTARNFGVAFDLGTTTIVGSLIDLNTGKLLGVQAKTNPQAVHGADVISRINFAVSQPGGLVKLQNIVIAAINEIIGSLCEAANVNVREIYEMSLAGNAIMNHLFLGVNPHYIAEAPYIPAYCRHQRFMAEELGITIMPRGLVYTLPNISGYVGGDITGFILACDLHKTEKITLGIDIGTNGEIVLGSRQRLLACSTAAGPAFEGGHISCGMRAMEGAIDKFTIGDDQIFYHVIGETDARGICGTGLIDIVAELVTAGVIDETGRIVAAENFKGPEWLKSRIQTVENSTAFVISAAEEATTKKSVVLTQQDVRELQLANGAVAAGIAILMKELGIEENDIEEILIAGAFGSYLNKYNAQKIGLIPRIPSERVKFVGNAASLGAKKYLLSNRIKDEAETITKTVQYIELSSRADFQELFADKMLFSLA
ncbi:MAG: ASKHA domain-containing protein [Candidatus Zhuqueibacterota bacterium]